MFGHKNKYQNVKYKLHIKIQTIAFTSSDEAFTSDNCTILTVFEVPTLKITASIYMYTQRKFTSKTVFVVTSRST